MLASFPILPRGIQTVIVISIAAVSLIHFIVVGRKAWNRHKMIVLLSTSSLCIIYIFSLIWVDDFKLASKFIVRSLPLLLLSFAFLNYGKFSLSNLKLIFKLFITTLLLSLSFLHIYFIEDIINPECTPWMIRNEIELFTKIHGTYLSMWIGMGILLLLWFFAKSKKRLLISLVIAIVLMYFLYWQFLLGARMPFFATIIAVFYCITLLLRIPLKIVLGFAFLGSILFAFIFQDKIQSKVEELQNYENAIPEGKYEITNILISNENVRSVIYHCALQKIKERPILGYGIGQDNIELQKCYDSEFGHTDLFKVFSFNSHSQYLQLLLSSGFLGLILFLISMGIWIKKSSEGTELYLPFLILALLCFMFENILNRHDGIIFFSFFNSILLLSGLKSNVHTNK
ncbi:MAG: hypothetical protein CL613_00680 [Aquimarina sp.]|nr:hypothetical protein [Aquimarina sp.]